MKDEVTHSYDLIGLLSFMFKRIEANDAKAIAYYPSLFNGESLKVYGFGMVKHSESNSFLLVPIS